MKIKSLEFEAFGPYLNRQFLDFTRLNEAELFLVTGDTGAGKTTIFDAVSFALYGVSSGDVRQISQFRNQKADSDVETYVRLTFEIRNRTYVITRYPNYLRDGYKTETRHRAYLEGAGEHIIDGVSEVASKVKEIVGVDADEFRQVAMIAQGQFTRLIQASSREREAILRELFSTHAYASFQERLKKEEKERKDQYQESKTKLDTYLENIEDKKAPLDYLSSKQSHIERKQLELKDKKEKETIELETINTSLQKALSQDQWENELRTFEKEKNALDLKREEMQHLHQKIAVLENVNKVMIDYLQYQKAMTNQNDLLKRLNLVLEKKSSLDLQMSELQTQQEKFLILENHLSQNEKTIEKINEDLHKVEQLEKAKSLVRQAKNLVDATSLEVKSSQDKKKSLDLLVVECEEALAKLPNVEALKLSLTHQSSHLQLTSTKLNQIEQQKEKLSALLVSMKEKKATWTTKNQRLKVLTNEHMDLETRYQASLAGILASELKENEPCPVCGSVHHPCLAKLNEEDVTKETLDQHQKVLEKQNQELQSSFAELIETKQSLDLEKSYYEQLLNGETLEDLKQQYQKEAETFESEKQSYQETLILQQQLNTNYQSYLSQLEAWQIKDIDIQERFEAAKDNLQKRNENYVFIRGSFHDDFETLDVLIKRKSLLEREMRQQKTLITTFKENFDQIQKASLQNTGELSALNIEKQKVEEQCFNLSEVYASRLKQYHLSEKEFQELKNETENIESYKKTINDYEKQYSLVTSQMKELRKKLDGERLDSVKLSETKHTLDALLQSVEVEIEKNNWEMTQLKKQYHDIENALQSFSLLEKKYQEVYELSRLVSGQNPQKITFESYILAAYFEAILERANLRFVEMTSGRYALLRKVEGTGRAMQGLDLNVMDYESGKPRDIRTLSGGEAFKAALSLALGMADLISENAGGIELDTLFIDEGFGSLDERSLDIALDTLIELKQEHKVVGIISHVSQLKERLSAKIIVTHQKNTSIAKIS